VSAANNRSEGEVKDTEQSIGGKPVTVVAQPATLARLGTFYGYLREDVLFVVQAFDLPVAAEALATLP